jgi:hypothetical protein
MTTALGDRLERSTDQDRFFNYCLWEYQPIASCEHKFSPATLLYQTFAHAGLDESAYEMVDRIRAGIGRTQTVWGVKKLGNELSWEYYFYDYRRRNRERSMSRVIKAIEPLIHCTVQPNESHHYFMFSINVTNALVTGVRHLDEINMYIGNVGSTVSSGISYALTPTERRLENFYFFYKRAAGLDPIIGKVVCSAFIDPVEFPITDIIWPELVDCDTICVANKRHNDCIYFSGINVDQFIYFLERLSYPEPLVSFVKSNRSRLDHLLYDVGIDYTLGLNGLKIIKSGYYGTF